MVMVHECASMAFCFTLTDDIDIFFWKYCAHIVRENSVETKVFGSWVRNPNSNWHRPKTSKIAKKMVKNEIFRLRLGGVFWVTKKGSLLSLGTLFRVGDRFQCRLRRRLRLELWDGRRKRRLRRNHIRCITLSIVFCVLDMKVSTRSNFTGTNTTICSLMCSLLLISMFLNTKK